MTTRQDLILATVRTAIPAAVGWAIATLIAHVPVVAEWIAAVDQVLAQSAPGWTVTLLVNAAAIGLATAAYYWVARRLGQRWPIVERFLLGSVRQPVAYVDGRAEGVQVITTLPDPATTSRTEYQSALERTEEDDRR